MVVTPQLALRVAILGGIALVLFAVDLLPPLVPAGAVGRQVPRRGERQPRARGEGRGAARPDRRPQRDGAGRQPHRARGPGACRSACPTDTAQARAGDAPPRPRARQAARRRSGARSGATSRELPVQPGDAQDRRRPRRRCSICRRTSRGSRASRSSGSSCASTRTTRSARTCSARSARSPRSSSKQPRYSGVALGDRVGQSGHRVRSTTATCAGATAPAGSRSTRSGRPKGELSVRDPEPGKRLRLSIDFGVQKAGQAALERYGLAGRVRRDGPAQRRGAGARQQPELRPERVREGRARRRSTSGSRTPTTARRSPTARPRACTRRAPRSS